MDNKEDISTEKTMTDTEQHRVVRAYISGSMLYIETTSKIFRLGVCKNMIRIFKGMNPHLFFDPEQGVPKLDGQVIFMPKGTGKIKNSDENGLRRSVNFAGGE